MPSNPISRPGPSSAPASAVSSVPLPAGTRPSTQITSPAGAATVTARPSTNSVRSSSDRTSTCPTWGMR